MLPSAFYHKDVEDVARKVLETLQMTPASDASGTFGGISELWGDFISGFHLTPMSQKSEVVLEAYKKVFFGWMKTSLGREMSEGQIYEAEWAKAQKWIRDIGVHGNNRCLGEKSRFKITSIGTSIFEEVPHIEVEYEDLSRIKAHVS